MKIFKYETGKYQFRELVSSVFEITNLEMLHKRREDLLPPEELCFENESRTKFHEAFYKKYRALADKIKKESPELLESLKRKFQDKIDPLMNQ